MTFGKLNQKKKCYFRREYALANEYLGYDYFLSGTVFKGNNWKNHWVPHRKHKIKEDYKLIPHNGVYVVKSIINQNLF
jgi:riboflavin kinase/FMN adenylyltransferase